MTVLLRAFGTHQRYVISSRAQAEGVQLWAGLDAPSHAVLPLGLLSPQQAQQRQARLIRARAREGFWPEEALVQHSQAFLSAHGLAWQLDADHAHALRQKLHPDVWRTLSPRQRSRLVWRMGELSLSEVQARLLTLADSGDAMLDYSLAWALGRMPLGSQYDGTMSLLMRWKTSPHKSPQLRSMAAVACMAVAHADARNAQALALIEDWPAALRQAWVAALQGDEGALHTCVDSPETWQRHDRGNWLVDLDLVAQAPAYAATGRAFLLAQLRQASFAHGAFMAIRRLYKAAEFRADAQVWALLHGRFESTRPNARLASQAWRDEDEQNRAWTGTTRNYFLRRNWRTLRRLGQVHHSAYIAFSCAVLLAQERSQEAAKPTPAHLQNPQFDLALRITGADTQRVPYADLWAQHPQALTVLLAQTQNEGVAQFAARLLSANAQACAQLGANELQAMLLSGVPASAQFALQQVRTRLANATNVHAQSQWLLVLTQSALGAAHALVLDTLSREPSGFAQQTDLALALLISPNAAVRQTARLVLDGLRHQRGPAQQLSEALLDWLEDAEAWSAHWPAVMDDVQWALQEPLRELAQSAAYDRVCGLLAHHVPQVVRLAVVWLGLLPQFATHPPTAALRRLIDSDDEAVLLAGAQLFAALPQSVHLQHPALLSSFAAHANAQIRAAGVAVVQALAQSNPQGWDRIAAQLVQDLVAQLCREPAVESSSAPSSDHAPEAAPDAAIEQAAGQQAAPEGPQADLCALLKGPLLPFTLQMERAQCLQLLTSGSVLAQDVGNWLLGHHQSSDYAVQDWVVIATSPTQRARQWAMQAFEQHPEQAQSQLAQALGLLDSEWEDVQSFALAYFAQSRFADDWSAELLLSLCDNSRERVQQLGRGLLQQHGDIEEATEYMLKLSQHPCESMQQFVGDWLEACARPALDAHGLPSAVSAATAPTAPAACSAPEAEWEALSDAALQRLLPFCTMVLSKVNRARVLKGRVQAFLLREALHSESAAQAICAVYMRQVLTVAIGDKAHYIQALHRIKKQYPHLAQNLTIVAPASKTGVPERVHVSGAAHPPASGPLQELPS